MDKYELAEIISHRIIELRDQSNQPREFDFFGCITQLLYEVKRKIENTELESLDDVADFIKTWKPKENGVEKLVIEDDNCTITFKEGSIEVKAKRD